MDNNGSVANFADSDFVTISPFPHSIPLPTLDSDDGHAGGAMKGNYVRAVGTCFAISSQGQVLTARHVIEDALQIEAGGTRVDPDMGIGALYTAETGEDNILVACCRPRSFFLERPRYWLDASEFIA